jgi:hypothetical protein
MANITVTFDAQGYPVASEPTVGKSEGITWTVTGGTVSGITQGTAFSAAPVNNRGWAASVESRSDPTGIGDQTYTITGTSSASGSTSKSKSPKIIVRAK